MDKNSDWKAVIADWKSSGLSQSEYCKRSGIIVSRFVYWKRKLEDKQVSQAQFVTVSATNTPIELEIGKVKLKLPVEMQSESLANLVKCLS